MYIDGTFGRGGHSRLILAAWRRGAFAGNDRDPQAIAVAKTTDDPRFSIIHGPLSALGEYVADRDLIGRSTAFSSILASLHRNLMMLARLFLYARWSAGHAYGPTRGQSGR
ncbi:16S rRNA (cytosine(1402)-N(4))-methyltransferase [Shigella sonnei]